MQHLSSETGDPPELVLHRFILGKVNCKDMDFQWQRGPRFSCKLQLVLGGSSELWSCLHLVTPWDRTVLWFTCCSWDCTPQMRLEPSRNSHWDWNPQAGTQTHCLLIEIAQLVSGLREARVLYVSVQKEFRERQSDWLEVDLLRERHTP